MENPLILTKALNNHGFDRLFLEPNDHLTQDIELILGFEHQFDPEALESAWNLSLAVFPHLTGQLLKADRWVLEPGHAGIRFEIATWKDPITFSELEQMPLADHRSKFLPTGDGISNPLLEIRLTHFLETRSVLGLRISHAAVDGTGLALLLHHCASAMRGLSPIQVTHDRKAAQGQFETGQIHIPHGYIQANPSSIPPDALAAKPSTIFAMDIQTVSEKLSGNSLLDTRLRLSAWLCCEIASKHPAYSEVAVWCDPRGLNGIPPTYTGNSGCHVHFLLEKDIAHLTASLRTLTTRQGFSRIAETHRNIRHAEDAGIPISWAGPGTHVLQLNLVPHVGEYANFGNGPPEFGLMLSRNSSGLRISITPDGTRFLIEACLENELGMELFHACQNHGLSPALWCQKLTSES
jgi:hypothetical protein